jgi:hypothetical protein
MIYIQVGVFSGGAKVASSQREYVLWKVSNHRCANFFISSLNLNPQILCSYLQKFCDFSFSMITHLSVNFQMFRYKRCNIIPHTVHRGSDIPLGLWEFSLARNLFRTSASGIKDKGYICHARVKVFGAYVFNRASPDPRGISPFDRESTVAPTI